MGQTETDYEWCEVHKSAEFAHGTCAVAALAPIPVTIPCKFIGTIIIHLHAPKD
jgi:hypothetical protein